MADPVPAKHPHATITIGVTTHPALIINWQQIPDARNIITWHARCLYWDDEPKIALVPVMRVKKA